MLFGVMVTLGQYTVTMFLVDISPSMGATRTVELPPGPGGEERSAEMTNLEWALQFVKFKIQEMVCFVNVYWRRCSECKYCFQIFGGRKTEQCGVIVFGSDRMCHLFSFAKIPSSICSFCGE